MPTQLSYPDGSLREVDNDQIEQAVAEGASRPDSVFVEVQTPIGTTRQIEVPYEEYINGDRQLTPESTLAANRHLADLEDETSTGGAFVRGFAEELSLGLYKPSEDQQLADSRYHDWSSGLGKIGGAVGPLLVPGVGTAGLAKDVASIGRGAEAVSAAGSAVKAGRGFGELSRAGKALELLPGRAAAQVGAGVTERLGGGFLGHVAGGAVEEAGRGVLRATLDADVDLSGEAILESTLYGMAGAGIGYGVAQGLKKAAQASEEAATKLGRKLDSISESDDLALAKRLSSNKEPTAAMLGKTDDELSSGIKASVESDISLSGANREVVKDVGQLEQRVKSWREDPFLPAAAKTKSVAETIDRGLESAKALRTYAKQTPEIQSRVMASYGQHLQNVDELADTVRRVGLPVDDLPTRYMPGNLSARQAALADLTGKGSAVETAAERLSLRLTAGTQRATAAKAVADSLLSRIPIVGKLAGKSGDSPLASLAVLDAVMGDGLGLTTIAAVGAKAAAKVISKAYEVPGRGMALSSMAAGALGRLGLPKSNSTEERLKSIRALSPDRASQIAIQKASALADVSQDAVLATGRAAARRQSALQNRIESIFGRQTSAIQLRQPKLTSNQTRALDRTLAIAGDPTNWAKLWAKDKLNKDDLKFASEVWPSHVNRAKMKAIEWLSDGSSENIPRNIASRLELLLGRDAVGAQKNDSALAAQQTIAASKERAESSRKSGPPPGVTPGGPPSRSLMDPASAISTRPTD